MVEGFTGLPRSGKTYRLAQIGINALNRGQKVYGNLHLRNEINQNNFHYSNKIKDFFAVRDGIILIDEINLVCPSRWWNKFLPELAYFWSQTGKFKLDVYWTSQHIDRVDKIIREISNFVWQIDAYKIPFFDIQICHARQYLPEHIGNERKEPYESDFFAISKKWSEAHYNTWEPIELGEQLKAQVL